MAKKCINSKLEKGLGVSAQLKGATEQTGNQNGSDTPNFIVQRHGPLILIQFTGLKEQHQALARMEAFYESRSDASNYVSLHDPKIKLLCKNYQAFNIPVLAIKDWLKAMATSEKALSQNQYTLDPYGYQGWWCSFTNPQKSHPLDQLWQYGCLKAFTNGKAPSYLISVTKKSAFQHELTHALCFLHPGYRDKVQQLWVALSKTCQLGITRDLSMRGYGEHVWIDEFQAYISEDEGGFGKKVMAECHEAGVLLKAAQSLAWKDLDLNASTFFQK